MIYDVVFTPEAEDTFESITNQLLQTWGIKTVIHFQEQISLNIDKIAKNPFLFKIIEESLQIRKCIVHRNCSMIYRINSNKVEIICFWDNRQEPMFE